MIPSLCIRQVALRTGRLNINNTSWFLASRRCYSRSNSDPRRKGSSAIDERRPYATDRDETSVKNDPNVFGTLSGVGSLSLNTKTADTLLPDDPDGYDKEEIDFAPRRNAYYYKYELVNHIRQGKVGLRRALELYNEMKSVARLEPQYENIAPLINACAREGYTKKAFELYDELLKYNKGNSSKSVVTSLINACANCPNIEYGQKRLQWLRDHLEIDRAYKYNEIQYKCLMKAHANLDQLEKASEVVQQMLNSGILPDSQVFCNLMYGCIRNTESGCTLALRVFKRMKYFGLRPDLFSYNLLLRAIERCGLGSPELLKKTIDELPSMISFEQRVRYRSQRDGVSKFEWLPVMTKDEILSSFKSEPQQLADKSIDQSNAAQTSQTIKGSNDDEYVVLRRNEATETRVMFHEETTKPPNLLDDDPLTLVTRIESIKADAQIDAPSRLLLFGGLGGFVESMLKDNCKPDIRTLTMLLDCTRRTSEDRTIWYQLAKSSGIKFDITLYNLYIRHICSTKSSNFDEAMSVIEDMHANKVTPNVMTYECLAGGCKTLAQAKELMKFIEDSGSYCSDKMVHLMLLNAAHRRNLPYLLHMIDHSRDTSYQPTRYLLEQVEESIIDLKKSVRDGNSEKWVWLSEEDLPQLLDKFDRIYSEWVSSKTILEEEHPWKQYKCDIPSKKAGLHQYVQEFKSIHDAKREALRTGAPLGNLVEKGIRSYREAGNAATRR